MRGRSGIVGARSLITDSLPKRVDYPLPCVILFHSRQAKKMSRTAGTIAVQSEAGEAIQHAGAGLLGCVVAPVVGKPQCIARLIASRAGMIAAFVRSLCIGRAVLYKTPRRIVGVIHRIDLFGAAVGFSVALFHKHRFKLNNWISRWGVSLSSRQLLRSGLVLQLCCCSIYKPSHQKSTANFVQTAALKLYFDIGAFILA